MTSARNKGNRKNALRSTGPKTPEGKAVVSLNAVRHGIFARVAVLPGVEDPAEWADHLRLIGEDLRPDGYLQRFMAERIAGITWRMGRAARWERELIATKLEEAQDPVEDYRKEYLRTLHARLEKARELLPRLLGMEDTASVPPPDAWALIEEVYDHSGDDPGDDEEEECLARAWTAGELREYLEEIADGEEGKPTWKTLQRTIPAELEDSIRKARRDEERETLKENRERRKTLLPDAADAEKLLRYEGNLERSLYRSLRELARLKDGRTVEVPGEFVSQNAEEAR